MTQMVKLQKTMKYKYLSNTNIYLNTIKYPNLQAQAIHMSMLFNRNLPKHLRTKTRSPCDATLDASYAIVEDNGI